MLHSQWSPFEVVSEFPYRGWSWSSPLCWGNNFVRDEEWKSQPAKRSKAKDPHQLRVNSYRGLLTRGRDGFIVIVLNEIGKWSIYGVLMERG
ncbi:MAG: DUF2075 domain-containing protein [Methanoregula sp.]|nr:DUF2075 domain-containing protein [Methanoregula sp.]MDD5189024.1 DUF2075 domain-containing protein [Methanoregula sp.]